MKDNIMITDNDAMNCRRFGKKMILAGTLSLFLLTSGCITISKDAYRRSMIWDPVPAGRLIEASVRIEPECKFTPEFHQLWKSFLNTDETIANYQQASCDAIVDDMTGSHVFRRVVSSSDPNYDLLIKLVSINSKESEKISLSVIDPKKQDVIANYDGTATLLSGNFTIWNEAVKRVLADIRNQMTSDYQAGKGIRSYLAAKEVSPLARQTGDGLPVPVRAEVSASAPNIKPEPIPKNIQRSGYTLEYEGMVSNMTKGAFDSAFTQADALYQNSQKTDKAKQNRYLSLLERGKVALAARKFDRSIADLQEAEKRFLTIEGTLSLTEGFGSILTDDTAMEYEAEMHEKLMISPYLIIAYLSKGDFNGALVERNRTITKINQYIQEKPVERAYLENPFARYLTAVMYEMEDKKDDAKIEYKKLKWEQEIVRIDGKKDKTTDLVILVDVGLAPQKFQRKWGPTPIPGIGVVGFAYAEYAPTPTEVTACNVYLDEKSIGSAKLLYDLENTVITQYDKNKPALQAKIVARMTAKATTQFAAKMAAKEVLKNVPFASLFADIAIDTAGAAWMAAEQADLRGWLSLPKQIKYIRVDGLEPGEHTIKIDYGCGVETRKIKVEKDKINIAYFAYAK